MNKPVILGGKTFTPELLTHLNDLRAAQPRPSKAAQARTLCAALNWFSPTGRPAVASAQVALYKLEARGLLAPAGPPRRTRRPKRLRPSGQPLPPVTRVPGQVDRVQGLHLHLLTGADDPFHGVWNDLIIQQHPCGAAPLVGAQLRYLIGSAHGWLGAVGFGPAAFRLAPRDHWIGWSPAACTSQLRHVLGLARLLLRTEVKCQNLATKVLHLALARVAQDWQERYHCRPLLVETFVDRTTFTGRTFAAANWQRLGTSCGRGRLGAKIPSTSRKDIWVYPLSPTARAQLVAELPPAVTPHSLETSLAQTEWCAHELRGLQLGDERLHRRAQQILQARWNQPQASFNASFHDWAAAKGAYSLIASHRPTLSLSTLLEGHVQATQGRMAAEPVVLLPQDTTSLNFSGLKKTTGLGPLGEARGQGLWLHTELACRPDGVPLGVLHAECWARPKTPPADDRGRNAKSLAEKESRRWVTTFETAAAAARRMTQTQLVVLADREGDLFELFDVAQHAPPNLQYVIRAQHDRNLACQQHLWAFMAQQPATTRTIAVPRRRGQAARTATLEVRWSQITITAPKVGCKKGWPPVTLWAVHAHEPHPPAGVEPIDWMLLSNRAITTVEAAWERVQWYRCRWGIEEWHRMLKTGCHAEAREFKTAAHLQRALAFDLIVAWRALACLKLGRTQPALPASILYTPDELAVLCAHQKKTLPPPNNPPCPRPN